MKNFFIYSSLVALSSPFLQISAVVPNQDTSLTTDTLNKLTAKIQDTLTQLANLPNNLRTTRPWQTLAWNVLNFTTFKEVSLRISQGDPDPWKNPLIDGQDDRAMHYTSNDQFNEYPVKNFINSKLKNAITKTAFIWRPDARFIPSEQKPVLIESLLQKVRDTIVELEKNQSQIPIIKDNNVRDSQGMRICKEFFQQGFKEKDVNSYSQTYQIICAENHSKNGTITVNKSEIEKNTYEPFSPQNTLIKDFATPINKLKKNIVRLVLFVKESMPYKDWVTGADKLPDIQKAGTNIVAFTPEIIDYLKRAYAALERIRNNDPIVRTLVCNEIRKICQAAGLSSPV